MVGEPAHLIISLPPDVSVSSIVFLIEPEMFSKTLQVLLSDGEVQ